jgi:hypothetical protein
MPTFTAADLLDRAADLLERDGWCQGTSYGPDGGMCLLAALQAARADLIWGEGGKRGAGADQAASLYRRAHDAVADAIGGDITEWNDGIDTSMADVLDLLRALASERRLAGATA